MSDLSEFQKTLNKETLALLEKQRKDLEIWLEEEISKLKLKEKEKVTFT